MRTGLADILLGAYREDASDFVFHERPLATSRMVFWTYPESKWSFDGPASLDGLKIGIIKDYAYGEELDPYFAKHTDRVQVTSGKNPLATMVRKLEHGRVDVIIEDDWVLLHHLQEHPDLQRPRWAGAVEGVGVFTPLSPANPEKSKRLAGLIDKTVKAFESDGRLERLLEKYVVKRDQ